MRETRSRWVRIHGVTVVPLLTWPILTLSIILIITSLALALFILLHKGRGGGMSDLFGGGTTTNMGGTSVAERNLDRITIVVGLIWLFAIFGLLTLYRFFPEVGVL
jgi:preprotein translocase subunit SecG